MPSGDLTVLSLLSESNISEETWDLKAGKQVGNDLAIKSKAYQDMGWQSKAKLIRVW